MLYGLFVKNSQPVNLDAYPSLLKDRLQDFTINLTAFSPPDDESLSGGDIMAAVYSEENTGLIHLQALLNYYFLNLIIK